MSRIRGGRVKIRARAALIIPAFLISSVTLVGCSAALLQSATVTTEAQQRVDAASLAGHRRLLVTDTSDPGSTSAMAYYFGPAPAGNPAALLSAPGLRLTHLGAPVGVATLLSDLFEGVAQGRYSDRCGLSVSKFRSAQAIPAEWKLTATEAAAVRSGRSEVVEVSVSCGSG